MRGEDDERDALALVRGREQTDGGESRDVDAVIGPEAGRVGCVQREAGDRVGGHVGDVARTRVYGHNDNATKGERPGSQRSPTVPAAASTG